MLDRLTLLAAVLVSTVTAQGQPKGTGAGDRAEAADVAAQRRESVVRLDMGAWRDLIEGRPATATIPGFHVHPRLAVTLDLERFRVTSPETRFVLGRVGGEDIPLVFDHESVLLYRGRVAGFPGSHVFIAVCPGETNARIDLGAGQRKYLMTTRPSTRRSLAPGEAAVLEAQPGSGVWLPAPACGVTEIASAPQGQSVTPPMRGLRRVRMAIETDYELFEIFGDPAATAAYVLQMYAAVSDIYMRDVSARIELSYVRIWDNPDDLYNGLADPLSALRSHWNNNQQAIARDVVQYFSGRRDLNAGGVAYLASLCNSNAYSWAGYALGYFIDPDRPNWTNRDVMVTAHELGHNCGTGHTHDYGLDNCDTGVPPAKRGSIMSYCGQGYSGGDANHDQWFHEHTANLMRTYMASRPCIVLDCDANGAADAADLSAGAPDLNTNTVPDVCEDCNGNGLLDPAEIATGTASDINGNLIPDSCEADCNGNGVPDSYECAQEPLIDLNRNRVPDSCEGAYNAIQADMGLDINRNLILDSLEDCDGDGATDAAELDHAWNIYITTIHHTADVREFHAESGVLAGSSPTDVVADGQDLLITPDRRVLVSSGVQNRVALLSRNGSHLGSLVAPGSGGLNSPAGMLLVGSRLLVASRGNNSVLEYDAASGAFMRALVAPGSGGLQGPFGLARHRVLGGDRLCVTTSNNRVLEYDLQTGAFVRVLVAANAGGLTEPRGLAFIPDGRLLVCSFGNDRILQFDGNTGAPLGQWNRNGGGGRLLMDQPWCIRVGPDGDVYVTRAMGHGTTGNPDDPDHLHLTDARVYQFDIGTGNYVRAYVLGDDTGLFEPTGFDFMPGEIADCNRNLRPDSCDIASGASLDVNGDGVPDECQPHCVWDFNFDGLRNPDDLSEFITCFFLQVTMPGLCPRGDFNGDGLVFPDDLSEFITAFFVVPC